MPLKNQLSDVQKGMIQAWSGEGISNREIARRLEISEGTVRYNLKKLQEKNPMENAARAGRPKVTTERADRHLVRTSRRNRFLTAPEIRVDLAIATGVEVSRSTVSRRLAAAGLHGRVARHKPRLTANHKTRRLAWARDHLTWTADDWARVLWSDESRFQLYQSDGRVYVRRCVGEAFAEGCVVPTVKHGGSGIMVWGCFSAAGVGDLVRVEQKIDAAVYVDVLRDHLIPSAHRLIGPEFLFQQDNAPPHTARITQEYLADPTPDFIREMGGSWEVELMEWPAQSPDLNPLENLWNELERQLRREVRPRNNEELFVNLQRIWYGLDHQILANLLGSMGRRCQAVIDAGGGFTRY